MYYSLFCLCVWFVQLANVYVVRQRIELFGDAIKNVTTIHASKRWHVYTYIHTYIRAYTVPCPPFEHLQSLRFHNDGEFNIDIDNDIDIDFDRDFGGPGYYDNKDEVEEEDEMKASIHNVLHLEKSSKSSVTPNSRKKVCLRSSR